MGLSKKEHDIKSSLAALQNAIEVVSEEWHSNQELVDRILPLMAKKVEEIKIAVDAYHFEKLMENK